MSADECTDAQETINTLTLRLEAEMEASRVERLVRQDEQLAHADKVEQVAEQHTDEIAIIASKRLRNKIAGYSEFSQSSSFSLSDCLRTTLFHVNGQTLTPVLPTSDTSHEAYPAWSRSRYLLQASRGGA